jgi:hypothetical protein
MEPRKSRLEKGQSMVVVALTLIMLVGMLALAIDGGFAYAARRNAQNAADAGALAGVIELCKNRGEVIATESAYEYAVTRNGADDAAINVSTANKTITVTTEITYTSFFAGLFGQPDIKTVATAAAGCPVAGKGGGMIPLAFPCLPWVEGSDSDDCGFNFGSNVILMDSGSSSDNFCLPTGTINCDTNGDGIQDVFNGSSRGWLDLNGGGSSASELIDWIKYGYNGPPIHPHLWVGGESGISNSVFQNVRDHLEGKVVSVPIFDLFCDKGLPETTCPLLYDLTYPDQTRPTAGSGSLYYRIVAVAQFKITCVFSTGSDKDRCPIRQSIEGFDDGNVSIKSIEGYFVDDLLDEGEGGAWLDAGSYRVRLIE